MRIATNTVKISVAGITNAILIKHVSCTEIVLQENTNTTRKHKDPVLMSHQSQRQTHGRRQQKLQPPWNGRSFQRGKGPQRRLGHPIRYSLLQPGCAVKLLSAGIRRSSLFEEMYLYISLGERCAVAVRLGLDVFQCALEVQIRHYSSLEQE